MTFPGLDKRVDVPLTVVHHTFAVMNDENGHTLNVLQILQQLRRQQKVLSSLLLHRRRHEHIENFSGKIKSTLAMVTE